MITDHQRDQCRGRVFELVLRVEKLKTESVEESYVREGVERWEAKVFEATKNDLEAYKKKISDKMNTLAKYLEETPPVSKLISTKEPTSSSAQAQKSPKEIVEVIREPLEQCRAILRILNMFGEKRDVPLKEEFLRIYRNTSEIIKNRSSADMTIQMLTDQVSQITKDLESLRGRLDPRFEHIKEVMQMDTLDELVEQDSQMFGILLHVVQVDEKNPGKDKHTQMYFRRAESASTVLGGKHALKRDRRT